MLLSLLALSMQPTSPPSPWPACTEEVRVCEVPLPPARELRAILGRRQEGWRVRDGVLTVVARRAEPARLCCAVWMPLRQAWNRLQAISLRVADLDSAIIDISIFVDDRPSGDRGVYRGPTAAPMPRRVPMAMERLAIFDIASRHLGGRREVRVYMPPGVRPGQSLPVVYLADGLSPALAEVAEGLWRNGEAAPFILAGIEAAPDYCQGEFAFSCDGRSLEYLVIPDLPPEQSRFGGHNRFVMEEVIPLVERSFPVSRRTEHRVTAGYSNGAAWALVTAARHPDTFGRGIFMSLGWQQAVLEAAELKRGQFSFGGGRLENHFHVRSVEAANAAGRAGAEVRLLTPNAGHSMENWEILFADALRWHFPPAQR